MRVLVGPQELDPAANGGGFCGSPARPVLFFKYNGSITALVHSCRRVVRCDFRVHGVCNVSADSIVYKLCYPRDFSWFSDK